MVVGRHVAEVVGPFELVHVERIRPEGQLRFGREEVAGHHLGLRGLGQEIRVASEDAQGGKKREKYLFHIVSS